MTPFLAFGTLYDPVQFEIVIKREGNFAHRVDVRWLSAPGSVEQLCLLAAEAFGHSNFDQNVQFTISERTVSALVPDESNHREIEFRRFVFEDAQNIKSLSGEWRVTSHETRHTFVHSAKIKTT